MLMAQKMRFDTLISPEVVPDAQLTPLPVKDEERSKSSRPLYLKGGPLQISEADRDRVRY